MQEKNTVSKKIMKTWAKIVLDRNITLLEILIRVFLFLTNLENTSKQAKSYSLGYNRNRYTELGFERDFGGETKHYIERKRIGFAIGEHAYFNLQKP
jgi:hypothetical protein